MTLSESVVSTHLAKVWGSNIVPSLSEYIAIPALSKNFDAEWRRSGFIDQAVAHLTGWAQSRSIANMAVDVVEIDGLTPVILITVDAFGDGPQGETVLLYGHLDKQPEMTGWRDGLGPWIPVREGDKLYGRGGADDGYAIYAALSAIEACQLADGTHSRLVVVIEASEESGSPDLPPYIEHYADVIGSPTLVVCLDSGCESFDRLWTTTSLRGLVAVTVTVKVVTMGIHSGSASGPVPSSMRIMRQLLDRVEDAQSGRVLLPSFHCEVPAHRVSEIAAQADATHSAVQSWFPFDGITEPTTHDGAQAITKMTWEPTLSYIGADGLPTTAAGGNVLRPSTSLRLSFRLPPTVDADMAAAELVEVLTSNPPYGATIIVDHVEGANGWNAATPEQWLVDASNAAGMAYFGAEPRSLGEGGSIPFMHMLGKKFPAAQFFVVGVVGPDVGAHGPDEYLHLPMAEKISCCVASILDAHGRFYAASSIA